MKRKSRPIKERFDEKFRVTPGCWIWTAGVYPDKGYGAFWLNGKMDHAHRVSHELYIGPIPSDLCVLHRCDNRLCVNPTHFFLGTRADNSEDMLSKGRQHKGNNYGHVGSAHAMSKLTEQDVIAIRADGRVARVVAIEYGVHPSSIYLIRANKIWRHVC